MGIFHSNNHEAKILLRLITSNYEKNWFYTVTIFYDDLVACCGNDNFFFMYVRKSQNKQ